MSSVQERLQLKRVPLDKWSIKEQLCLASAVACSGDQNWMSVSRSLKMLCPSNRPSDWFSQKSCAAQYGKLLENVETPKRKKRTISERDNAAVETPSELIVRKLTQERIGELKKIILEEQQQYLKIKEDILTVQTADENKLREMWNQIESENKQKEKERFLHSQWLKEREERKLEMERAWRPGTNALTQASNLTSSPSSSTGVSAISSQSLPQSPKTPLPLKIKTEDSMEIDEPLSQSSTSSTKQGTSPLLTSLLKSPSPAPISTATTTPTNIIHSTVSSHQIPSPAIRNLAPTITNLLTSNTITTTHATELKQTISTASTQSASSTLSMLLDPIQGSGSAIQSEVTTPKKEEKNEMEMIPFTDLTGESPSSNENDSTKDDDQQLMEVFNGLIPDNIDELADILTQTNAIISLSPELLEEGSILENVDSLIDEHEEAHGSNVKENAENLKTEKPVEENVEIDTVKIEEKVKNEWNDEEKLPTNDKIESEQIKIEKLDDDPGNNIEPQETILISPNSDVAPFEEDAKRDQAKNLKTEEVEKSNDGQTLMRDNLADSDIQQPSPQSSENDIMIIEDNTPPPSEQDASRKLENYTDIKPIYTSNVESPLAEANAKDTKTDVKIEILDDESKMVIELIDENVDEIEPKHHSKDLDSETDPKIDQSDVKKEKSEHDTIEIVVKSNQSSIDKSDDEHFEDIKEDIQIIEDSKDNQELTQSISLIDTDDDSPIEVIKEDKVGKQKRDYSRKKSDNQKIEDNNSNDDLSKANLSLRMKLKERDRSESPFILDDENDDIPRTRRRYSSTPNIDSVPNSPASSTATNDDRDYKLWKKSILIAFNRIQMHKHSSLFLKLDEQYANYKISVLRPMDMIVLKKNIEAELIRCTLDFQRDIMLMCNNLVMINSKMYLAAKEFLQDALYTIDSMFEVPRKDEKIGLSGGSTGGSSTSSTLNQSQSSNSSPFSGTSTGKGRGGRKSSRMSNV